MNEWKWWTLELRRVTKLEEYYQVWLAFGTPKVCASILEKRVHLLVESPIHEEKLFLSSSWNTKPAFLPLKDIWDFMGVCPTTQHMFGEIGEVNQPHPMGNSVTRATGVWGTWPVAIGQSVPVQLQWELGPYCWQSEPGQVHSRTTPSLPLSLILFITFIMRTLVAAGFLLCFLQMMWFCLLYQLETSSSLWVWLQPHVKQWKWD